MKFFFWGGSVGLAPALTQASATVAGCERRDGIIRQMINSRSLMKKIDSKKQFLYNSFELVRSLFNKMTTNLRFEKLTFFLSKIAQNVL